MALEETRITLMVRCTAFVRYFITVDHCPCNGQHFAARAKSWYRLPRVIITKTNPNFSCFFH